jgi:hypothetical protein
MAIGSLADVRGALRQDVYFQKTATSSANKISAWAESALPAAGSLSIGNTANGLVPDNTTTGAAAIGAFAGTGYLIGIEALGAATMRIGIYDRLFHCGSYNFNDSISLSAQPSFGARVPDYTGLQLFVECNAATTGALSVAVTYTNQDGTAAQSTGTVSVGALVARQMVQLPLAAGDVGVQKIESVTGTVATAGTFNIIVARPLYELRIARAQVPVFAPFMLRLVYASSCLAFWRQLDAAATPLTDLHLVLASK